MKVPLHNEGKDCWFKHLDAALEKYKNRVHCAIRMTPFETNNDKLFLIPIQNLWICLKFCKKH